MLKDFRKKMLPAMRKNLIKCAFILFVLSTSLITGFSSPNLVQQNNMQQDPIENKISNPTDEIIKLNKIKKILYERPILECRFPVQHPSQGYIKAQNINLLSFRNLLSNYSGHTKEQKDSIINYVTQNDILLGILDNALDSIDFRDQEILKHNNQILDYKNAISNSNKIIKKQKNYILKLKRRNIEKENSKLKRTEKVES